MEGSCREVPRKDLSCYGDWNNWQQRKVCHFLLGKRNTEEDKLKDRRRCFKGNMRTWRGAPRRLSSTGAANGLTYTRLSFMSKDIEMWSRLER